MVRVILNQRCAPPHASAPSASRARIAADKYFKTKLTKPVTRSDLTETVSGEVSELCAPRLSFTRKVIVYAPGSSFFVTTSAKSPRELLLVYSSDIRESPSRMYPVISELGYVVPRIFKISPSSMVSG